MPQSTGGKGVKRHRRGTVARTVAADAREIQSRLSAPEFTSACQFSEADLAALNACCSDRPPRNAASIIAGLKLKASYGYGLPKQQVEHSGNVSIVVVDPYAVDDEDVQ